MREKDHKEVRAGKGKKIGARARQDGWYEERKGKMKIAVNLIGRSVKQIMNRIKGEENCSRTNTNVQPGEERRGV